MTIKVRILLQHLHWKAIEGAKKQETECYFNVIIIVLHAFIHDYPRISYMGFLCT